MAELVIRQGLAGAEGPNQCAIIVRPHGGLWAGRRLQRCLKGQDQAVEPAPSPLRKRRLKDDHATTIIGYRARRVDGQNLHDCSLGFQNGGHSSAMRVLEAAYRLRRVTEAVQGTTHLTGYAGDLIGLSDAMVTVQSAFGMPNMHVATLKRGARLPR